ncbi:Protein Hook-like 2 [Acipenser ruthenus]|uniref:Protein Hook-like 2 n=1 Tax=Acipenser ruthenus TaxID=7906 RepID=A0A444UTX2_ACIRT|nr:Protein Hook-like 2 [Acipenser ruthenus]
MNFVRVEVRWQPLLAVGEEAHIQQIITLEESVQHVVMTAIQELMTKDSADPGTPETYGDFDNQAQKYYFLSEAVHEKEDLTLRCRELEQQLQTFQVPSCSSKQELTSGVAVAHVLHRM